MNYNLQSSSPQCAADSEEQQNELSSLQIVRHRDSFELRHNEILLYLNSPAGQQCEIGIATAILVSAQLTDKDPSHLLILAGGAIPAVCDYKKNLGQGIWKVSTLQSKRRLRVNSIWDRVEVEQLVIRMDTLPDHVAFVVQSGIHFNGVRGELELTRSPLEPVSSDDGFVYIPDCMPFDVNVCFITGKITFSMYDCENNKMDSVNGLFTATNVS